MSTHTIASRRRSAKKSTTKSTAASFPPATGGDTLSALIREGELRALSTSKRTKPVAEPSPTPIQDGCRDARAPLDLAPALERIEGAEQAAADAKESTDEVLYFVEQLAAKTWIEPEKRVAFNASIVSAIGAAFKARESTFDAIERVEKARRMLQGGHDA